MDNYLAKLYKNGEVYKEEEFGKIEIKPWQIFTEKQHLRDTMRDYCIQNRFSIVVQKANNKIYTVLCSDQRCPWRLHGSVLADGVSWAIKSITGDHTCLGLQTRNPMVSAKWAQRVLLEDIRAHNDIPGKALNKLLFERYGVTLPKSTIHRMKSEALVEIHGGFDVSYSYLPRYCEVSIDKACNEIWPTVDRRYCCKHLSVNFKGVFPRPKMWQLFWLAANATSDFIFGKAMKQMEKVKAGARVWLSHLGEQSRWSKHQFNPAFKCDVNNTNFVESFNATLGTDRARPVMTLLEGIRRVSMVRMATRRESCEKWDRQDICPNIVKRVKFLCKESRLCLAYKSSAGEYEIVDGKSTLPVSLNNHTCTCNAWQLTGVPCKHGMRAILDANLDPHRFVHEWHSWPETQAPEIGPPAFRRGVGRPTKNRKRGEEEQRKGKRSKTIKCGICGQFGHNKLTCQRAPTRKQKKGKEKKAEGAATTSKKGKKKAQNVDCSTYNFNQ
ncbi:Zinc finger CCHC domain-containing protein 12 [Bienertia sinuspersici]